MTGILLTKSSTFIIGDVANILGYLMNAIFILLEKIGIPNIGLAIILFTIVIYLCMLPITVKQQKFSKLSAKMNPEIQAIQNKYKGKRDNESMIKMNEETQAVYKKYGVSPTGSCMFMLVQLPILFALYQVIYNIPAYVTMIKASFTDLVSKLMYLDGASEVLQKFKNAPLYAKQFSDGNFVAGSEYMQNTFIDVLNKASSAEWMSLKTDFPAIADTVQKTYETFSNYNYFLGLNIADSPSYIITESIKSGSYGLAVGAFMIPLLAALTQFLNVKLMPQPEPQKNSGPKNETADTMMQSMKTMNTIMPIMSFVMCFSFATGLGLYWVIGSVVRSVQQVFINRYIDKIDFDEVIRKNALKEEENRKKDKNNISAKKVNSAARMNTKNISSSADDEKVIKHSNSSNAKKGSIAAKANMVREFNEKNSK